MNTRSETLYEIEKAVILGRLKSLEYNITITAESLGVTFRTVYNKLYNYGITPKDLKLMRRALKERNRNPWVDRPLKPIEEEL